MRLVDATPQRGGAKQDVVNDQRQGNADLRNLKEVTVSSGPG